MISNTHSRPKPQVFYKRKTFIIEETSDSPSSISSSDLNNMENAFNSDEKNILARNAITSVGSLLATTNSDEVNKVSHLFLNSIKKHPVKATNQGRTGRCWMYSSLNMFKYLLINSLHLQDFNFSHVFLFFFDKLERSNSLLKWFVDNKDVKEGDRSYDFMLDSYLDDGGFFNFFTNLIEKYGIVPESAMKETYQSSDSDDLNSTLKEKLDEGVNKILKAHKLKKTTTSDLEDIRSETVSNIYSVLVKYLGHPPTKFDWSYTRHLTGDEEDSDTENVNIVKGMTPLSFFKSVIPLDVRNEFITLSHIPSSMKFYRKYTVRNTNNVLEGDNCTLFNVPIEELVKYTTKSILAGMPVWFVADVNQSFNWFHSTLDDKLDSKDTVFGKNSFTKEERIKLRNIQGNHAMCFVSINIDDKGRPITLGLENSWGFVDSEIPGLDGFLSMSLSWFKKYVFQVVINRAFFSRTFLKKYEESETTFLNPWDSIVPAIKAGGKGGVPHNYLSCLEKRKNMNK